MSSLSGTSSDTGVGGGGGGGGEGGGGVGAGVRQQVAQTGYYPNRAPNASSETLNSYIYFHTHSADFCHF